MITVTINDIRSARDTIGDRLHRTPVVTSATLSRMTGHRIHLKLESLQKTGSFKPRGAINNMGKLVGFLLAFIATWTAFVVAGVATHLLPRMFTVGAPIGILTFVLAMVVYLNLPDEEILWATSMPSAIRGDDSIPIAQYARSNVGRKKTVYR